jgi:hypothetical protein
LFRSTFSGNLLSMANKHDTHADFILERTLAGDPRAKIARDLVERGLETSGDQIYRWLKKRQARIQKNLPLVDPVRFMAVQAQVPAPGIPAVENDTGARAPGQSTADIKDSRGAADTKSAGPDRAASNSSDAALSPHIPSKASLFRDHKNHDKAELVKSQSAKVASSNPFIAARKGKSE